MIRQPALDEIFEPDGEALARVWASCTKVFVSPSLPEGMGVQWPTGPDLPLLSVSSEIAIHQATVEWTVEFSTADASSFQRGRLRRDSDLRLVEDTQAFLRCVAEGGKPGSRLRAAWEEFFRLLDPLVRRVAWAGGMSRADGEDCAQEVWAAIIMRLPQFDCDPSKGRFGCWISRLIHNRVADFARQLNRRTARYAALPEEPVSHRDADPAAAYGRSERRSVVRHVLGHLEQQVSPTNYRLVHLRWLEGHEVPSVAAELGLSREQVWHRHGRMKKRLRRLLEAHSLPR